MIARMSVRLMSEPNVISDFRIERSFHSSCGRAGNFSLPVQRKVTKRKHVVLRVRGTAFQVWIGAKPSNPLGRRQNTRCRQAIPTYEATSIQPTSMRDKQLRPACFLDEHVNAIYAAFPTLRGVKPEAPRNVLSFLVTSFFARAKKEVTRSSAGGVEALLQDQNRVRTGFPLSRE
jgi:hypothetical protein